MSVKLLQKSELQSLKAKERALEVREGVKLATKVDGLRELQAKTEKEFELYKTSTLSAITEEITKTNEEKEKISGELRILKEEYDLLLPEIPIKRKELAEFEKTLMKWEHKLEKREEKAGLSEIDVAEALDTAESIRIMNEDNERISRNLLIQTNKAKIEAEQTLATARKIQEQAFQELQDSEATLNLRELSIKTKEQELSRTESILMNDQRELINEKRKVDDMRQTLQRSIERIKNNRLA